MQNGSGNVFQVCIPEVPQCTEQQSWIQQHKTGRESNKQQLAEISMSQSNKKQVTTFTEQMQTLTFTDFYAFADNNK